MAQEIFILPLTDSGSPDTPGRYIYLPPPSDPAYSIRFTIEGASSICREGSLWINFPRKEQPFDRNVFREIRLQPDFNNTIEIDVPVFLPGAFAFYVTYTSLPLLTDRSAPPTTRSQTDIHYIDVAPRLLLNGEYLPFNSLSTFSVISKFLGDYPSDWNRHFKGIQDRGYNIVHFTPLAQRGESDSPYSIYDQLEFDIKHFPNGEKDIKEMVTAMESNYGLLGLTDVVWNHTANNSQWLKDHPEAGYNTDTAPWLTAALDLDDALLNFGSRLTEFNLPSTIKTASDLQLIIAGVDTHVISSIKLWEYYVIEVSSNAKAATTAWKNGNVMFPDGGFEQSVIGGLEGVKEWSLEKKAEFLMQKATGSLKSLGARHSRAADPAVAAALLTVLFGRYEHEQKHSADDVSVYNEMVRILDVVNVPLYEEFDRDKQEIMKQLKNRIQYLRLDAHGPQQGPISQEYPLIESYFTRFIPKQQQGVSAQKKVALVNNGWIWNADAMVDNAGSSSKAYLRREVIVWGDCVKLRYGTAPKDNPWLWEHMAQYTRLMAKYFKGLRIDNCHSTPLVVAEYLLDEARRVRPDIMVCAELFTGSEEMDYLFVKRLGLNALIREAMQAWSTEELSRLVHLHGGRPIGSFDVDELAEMRLVQEVKSDANKSVIFRGIRETPVRALFMDCTHDNEVPAQKRDARDTLPTAALVAFCACAVGSVMGYDEVYPKLIDLVNEKRLYTSASSEDSFNDKLFSGGIGVVKKILNETHTIMGKNGYDEMYVHHEGEYITVHRVDPGTLKGYFLIAHTAFPGSGDDQKELSPIQLAGTSVRHIGSWTLEVDVADETRAEVLGDKEFLRGLPSKLKYLETGSVIQQDSGTLIKIPNFFPKGSIAIFETWISPTERFKGLTRFISDGATEAVNHLDLVDINHILYRCDAEERDSSSGRDGVYEIPGFGPLVYCGLQGWWSVLQDVARKNDLGHPVCQHLRDGSWALDYTVGRINAASDLTGHGALKVVAVWLAKKFDEIKKVPSFLLPRYFTVTIHALYVASYRKAISMMSHQVRSGQPFLQRLAMVSVQQMGRSNSASLYPDKIEPCLAAGLPHFSTDWARCWGRDVFISLRGLLLVTGRFDEAKAHILAFASVLKHGLIPNLLSRGRSPRYNARDSVWFFLQSIQDYTKIAPRGVDILKERVSRRFLPYDDTWFEYTDERAFSKSSTVEDIIQEILQRHATGLSFREANAGFGLDMQMKEEGFQIDVAVDWTTGFVFGGSQVNCGTWQDKMGESERAGNKGIPGTPRDGAAIEITGLLYSALVWVVDLRAQNKYSHSGVSVADKPQTDISFRDWVRKIEDSFERCYYIPVGDTSSYDVDQKLVNRRGIYKDLYKSGKSYEDYQLRANFPIAMCVAPDLFTPEFAFQSLLIADKVIRGPTGMATLDPKDLNYNPYYVNSEDSDSFATAKGRNYHQGPEWLWPTGFFLRALLMFDLKRRTSKVEYTESFQQITQRLKGCKAAIRDSPWAGLTELTQKDGQLCQDSCPSQAWSAGCLLDLFYDASLISL